MQGVESDHIQGAQHQVVRLQHLKGHVRERRPEMVPDVYGVVPMMMNEYQKLAMRTCSIPYEDTGAMLNHAIFGLTSEAGEVAGILQKVYQGHEADPEHMKKELGDCLWMIAEAATALRFDLEDVAATNIRKLKKRYPDGFDAERSIHREEGDI
jgi:NTP pyrophosphatase (non-canonical NTP hydrolase)